MKTKAQSGKIDRRAMRSKRLILTALRELILEKDYKEVSALIALLTDWVVSDMPLLTYRSLPSRIMLSKTVNKLTAYKHRKDA
jgi:hypothetical protein